MTALTPAGRALFLELVDLPEAARAEALAERCKDAPELAAEVAALLAADARAEGFLEPPSIAQVNDLDTSDDDPSGGWLVGRRIGQYTLGPRIGVGGMGTVYVAEQDRPRRMVALKLLRTSYASPNLRRRFEREVEILGRLRHPGIAEIYEAGTHQSEIGRIPYFALEYIPEAKSITRWADDSKLDARARVELLARVCDAVAEAHRHGIVHRDIKPSNVLVGRDGAPKLIDFGIARWLDDPDAAGTVATKLGDLLGTLHYMSPEQFDGEGPGPSAASDVYALGVVAYELIGGKLPYPISRTNAARIAELVRTHIPEPLTRAPVRWRALDAVVQMALAKKPQDRYPDAAELAADLRRACAGEPVRARRSHRSHRLRTFAWRSRWALPWVAAAGAAATAIALARRDESAAAVEPTASSAEVLAHDDEYRHHVAAAERALAANDLARAKVELGACAVDDRGWEWHRLLAQVERAVQVIPLGSPSHLLVHDPTRGIVVATSDDGVVHGLRATPTGAVPRLDPAWRAELGEEPTAIAVDPPRGLVYVGGASGRVHRLESDDGSDSGSLGADGASIDGLTLWHGELVVTRHDRAIERWDVDAGTRTSSARTEHQLASLAATESSVFGAWNSWGVDEVDPRDGSTVRTFAATEGIEAILADGDTVYMAGWQDRITALDRRGDPRHFELQPDGLVDLVAPDAGTLISAGRDGAIAIWDSTSGTLRQRLRGHDFGVDALAIGGDGRWLASVSLDRTLRTWDLHAPPIDRVLRGAGDKIQDLAFDGAGERVIAAIGPQWGRLDNDAVHAWTVVDGRTTATTTDHAVTVDAIAVAPDGATIVTASRDGTVHVREPDDLTVRHVLVGPNAPVIAFVDATTFVIGGEDGTLAWWTTDGGALERRDAGVGAIADVVSTHDAVAVGGVDGLATLARTGDATRVGDFANVTAVATLDDGALVLGHGDGTLSRVELDGGAIQWSVPTFGRAVTDVAVSPDGLRIATSNQDYRIRLHDARTGDYLLTVGAHESVATSVAFSPDGRTLASGGYDRVVRLWHAPTASVVDR